MPSAILFAPWVSSSSGRSIQQKLLYVCLKNVSLTFTRPEKRGWFGEFTDIFNCYFQRQGDCLSNWIVGVFNACKEQILIQHSWNGFNKHDPRHVLVEPSWIINGPLQIILLYSSSSVFLTLYLVSLSIVYVKPYVPCHVIILNAYYSHINRLARFIMHGWMSLLCHHLHGWLLKLNALNT